MRRTRSECAPGTLTVVSPERRAAILELPVSAVTHAGLLAELPFSRTLEVAPPHAPTPACRAPARVVAWNAERCKRVEAAAGLLGPTGADAILLSELDWGMARSAQRHATRELAAALGCGYVFAVEFLELGLGNEAERARHAGEANAVGYHGGAILSRHPLLEPALVRLGGDGDWFDGERGERRVGGRIAVLAKLRVAGTEVALASVHFESHADPSFRAAQMRALLDAFAEYAPGAPALVGGDVNAHSLGRRHFRDRELLREALEADPERLARPVPHEPLFAVAEAAGFDWRRCNAEGSTERRRAPEPSARGVLKLDWFFATGLATSAAEVIPAVDGAGAALSDHDAIAVTLAPGSRVIPPAPGVDCARFTDSGGSPRSVREDRMDYHELKHKTVAELREIAAGLEGLTGYTQMRKEQVLEAICRHQGIEMHAHHVVSGIDKASIKQNIRALKAKRDEAVAAHDGIALKRVRRKIHRLKRGLHRATV